MDNIQASAEYTPCDTYLGESESWNLFWPFHVRLIGHEKEAHHQFLPNKWWMSKQRPSPIITYPKKESTKQLQARTNVTLIHPANGQWFGGHGRINEKWDKSFKTRTKLDFALVWQISQYKHCHRCIQKTYLGQHSTRYCPHWDDHQQCLPIAMFALNKCPKYGGAHSGHCECPLSDADCPRGRSWIQIRRAIKTFYSKVQLCKVSIEGHLFIVQSQHRVRQGKPLNVHRFILLLLFDCLIKLNE